jgi:hypothetical protein
MKLLTKILRNKKPTPVWSAVPKYAGWYVVFQRGRGLDIIYYSGELEDDPCFELSDEANYFGPFQLPLV